MKLNLNNFGKKLKLIKRTKKSEEPPSEEEIFIETVDLINECWNKSNKAFELFKINLIEYEEGYFQALENLLYLKYGVWKTELVLWYVFGRVDEEGEILPLNIQHKDTSSEEEIVIKNPKELWNLFERLEELKRKDENNEE